MSDFKVNVLKAVNNVTKNMVVKERMKSGLRMCCNISSA